MLRARLNPASTESGLLSTGWSLCTHISLNPLNSSANPSSDEAAKTQAERPASSPTAHGRHSGAHMPGLEPVCPGHGLGSCHLGRTSSWPCSWDSRPTPGGISNPLCLLPWARAAVMGSLPSWSKSREHVRHPPVTAAPRVAAGSEKVRGPCCTERVPTRGAFCHTHKAESDQSNGESLRTEDVWAEGSLLPRPDPLHLFTLASGGGSKLLSSYSLAVEHRGQRWPPGGTSMHLLSWMSAWGVLTTWGSPGLSDQRREHLTRTLCHAWPLPDF